MDRAKISGGPHYIPKWRYSTGHFNIHINFIINMLKKCLGKFWTLRSERSPHFDSKTYKV